MEETKYFSLFFLVLKKLSFFIKFINQKYQIKKIKKYKNTLNKISIKIQKNKI